MIHRSPSCPLTVLAYQGLLSRSLSIRNEPPNRKIVEPSRRRRRSRGQRPSTPRSTRPYCPNQPLRGVEEFVANKMFLQSKRSKGTVRKKASFTLSASSIPRKTWNRAPTFLSKVDFRREISKKWIIIDTFLVCGCSNVFWTRPSHENKTRTL